MKKNRFCSILAVAFVSAMLLTACRSPVEPGVQSGPQAHYGTVSITFGDGPARTIYPTKAFDAYVYTFTPAGGAAQVLTPVNGVFTLEAGNWNVRVDAYVGAVAPVNLAASGEANFTLDASENKAVSITLAANETSGVGAFSWHIIYPAGTTVETFTLRKLPGLTDVALTPQAGERTMTGTAADVPSGAYMLDIRLANDGLYAGATEIVYIYALLTTEYGSLAKPVVFEGQDFLGVFTDLDDVAQYLDEHTGGTSVANSILLPLAFDLGNMPQVGSGWRNLLDVIEAAGKYVALDLSACTMTGTDFDPVYFVATGKDKIVSMDLPDVAASIIAGDNEEDVSFTYFSSLTTVTAKYVLTIDTKVFNNYNNPVPNLTSVSFPAATFIGYGAFAFCTGLESVSFSASADLSTNPFYGCLNLTTIKLFGTGPLSVLEGGKALVRNNTELVLYPSASGSITMNTITSIGENAFQRCTNVVSVSFPAVTSIGGGSFRRCINLKSVDFPVATSVDSYAFHYCTSLKSVSFPAVTGIGGGAFVSCTSLESISFPAAASIGSAAFYECTSLESVSFPTVTDIGEGAFVVCTSLENASFPAATSIGSDAFSECTGLINVFLPAAASIGIGAFQKTGDIALTITLGATPPTVDVGIFWWVSNKNVTVRFPAEGAAAYGSVPTDTVTQNWGNAFRGMGWDGTAYLDGEGAGNQVHFTYVLIEDGEGVVTFAYYWVNERDVIATASGAATAGGASGNAFVLPFGNSLTITANGSGYTNQRWFIDGVEDSAQAGNAAYVFSSAGKAPKRYTVGLIVEKGGRYYNVNFAVTVG